MVSDEFHRIVMQHKDAFDSAINHERDLDYQ